MQSNPRTSLNNFILTFSSYSMRAFLVWRPVLAKEVVIVFTVLLVSSLLCIALKHCICNSLSTLLIIVYVIVNIHIA